MNEVTRIINAIQQGDGRASEELLPLVYEELRLLAAQKMGQEKPGQTLQATSLVHEAYIRLVGGQGQNWDNKGHFFKAAAEAMRRILVEKARSKKTHKRGGGEACIALDGIEIPAESPSDGLIALDEALTKLGEQEPALAEVVELRYFAGLTLEQIAKILGVSRRTATSYWSYARAWLRREITEGGPPGQ